MSRVVVVKYQIVAFEGALEPGDYRRMLTAAFKSLTDKDTIKAAVRKYLPNGVLGLKVNGLAKRLNSTPVALVDALNQLLQEADFDANDVVIWDRTSRELAEAGFSLNVSGRGVRCLGTDANGIGHARGFYTSGEVSSLISRILTDLIDFNINLPILKDHSIAGLSASLKNMYGAIHNPNKYHGNNCDPFCAQVNDLEPIKSKNRLSIIDAVRVQYEGGPGYLAQYQHLYGGIIISDDPVAADRVGLALLERIRTDHDKPPLAQVGREVKYLETAGQLGLGMADLAQIDLRVLTMKSDGETQAGELF